MILFLLRAEVVQVMKQNLWQYGDEIKFFETGRTKDYFEHFANEIM
jgi:hypothetical protein